MRLWRSVIFIILTVALAACGRLGVGDQICEDNVREPSPANVLSAQAVPTARYTPCFNSLEVGWDDVAFEAERGSAGISVANGTETFLTAVVTADCDVSGARRVMSGFADIEKYIDVDQVQSDISIAVLPVATHQLAHAVAVAERWDNTQLGGRRLLMRIDPEFSAPIESRMKRALTDHQYMWLIDQLNVEENTVELRSVEIGTVAQISAEEALDVIEDDIVTEAYRGKWYFTFEGGCITYTFDAEGPMARTVAADATANLGFYPAYQLRDETGR